MTNEHDIWQWQEPDMAWKGAGLYHITLTIPSREPLLGRLVIPDGDATKAKVERTVLGEALVECLLSMQRYHEHIQVLHFCLMPDHLHVVIYVTHKMPVGIGSVVRGFWQAAKKIGRASSFIPNGIRGNYQEAKGSIQGEKNYQELLRSLQTLTPLLRSQLGDAAYYALPPIFTEHCSLSSATNGNALSSIEPD